MKKGAPPPQHPQESRGNSVGVCCLCVCLGNLYNQMTTGQMMVKGKRRRMILFWIEHKPTRHKHIKIAFNSMIHATVSVRLLSCSEVVTDKYVLYLLRCPPAPSFSELGIISGLF